MFECIAVEYFTLPEKGVVECYKAKNLNLPNEQETKTLLQSASVLSFSGILGPIDWCKGVRNHYTSNHGHLKGKEKVRTTKIYAIAIDRL